MNIKRGDILLVDLEPVKGSEQGKTRPTLVIQNNVSNQLSTTTIIAPFTSKTMDKDYPTDVNVYARDSPLQKDSTVLLNQIKVISGERIISKIGSLNNQYMEKVDEAIKISLGLEEI